MSSPSPLAARVIEDMKAAMRAKDAARLSTIRMLTAAMKQKEVDERVVLTDGDVLAIVDKLIKQRRDSISQFDAAKRVDLADKERAEVEILAAYLPAQLSEADLAAEVDAAIEASGGTGREVLGRVMGALKQKLAGRADMTRVAAIVKARLAP